MNDHPLVAQPVLTTEITVASQLFPELKGTFVVRYPTSGDELKISLLKARLQQGVAAEALDILGRNLIQIIATLTVVVVKGPSWFFEQPAEGPPIPAPAQVPDPEVLAEVHEQYIKWLTSFRHNGAGGTFGTASPGQQAAQVKSENPERK